ncbi:hypothetical protein PAXINDRAFT_76777, partial [Paxillus involutus ATCC 200175]
KRKQSQKRKKIPRRHEPVLQWQGHHVPGVASRARRDQGRQKFDNQRMRAVPS